MLAYEILNDMLDENYPLDLQEHITFSAYYQFLVSDDPVDKHHKELFEEEEILRMVPEI